MNHDLNHYLGFLITMIIRLSHMTVFEFKTQKEFTLNLHLIDTNLYEIDSLVNEISHYIIITYIYTGLPLVFF